MGAEKGLLLPLRRGLGRMALREPSVLQEVQRVAQRTERWDGALRRPAASRAAVPFCRHRGQPPWRPLGAGGRWMKQGGGLDSAHRPCVCHLCRWVYRTVSLASLFGVERHAALFGGGQLARWSPPSSTLKWRACTSACFWRVHDKEKCAFPLLFGPWAAVVTSLHLQVRREVSPSPPHGQGTPGSSVGPTQRGAPSL